MTVTLTSELEKFIAEQIRSGHFLSANDVIVQSLGLLRAQEEFISSNTAELREKINVGLEQIRRGETVEAEAAIQQLREQLSQQNRDGK